MKSYSNKELSQMPEVGETIRCWICGEDHKVEYGHLILEDGTKEKSNILGFFKCSGKSYLCALNGKFLRIVVE